VPLTVTFNVPPATWIRTSTNSPVRNTALPATDPTTTPPTFASMAGASPPPLSKGVKADRSNLCPRPPRQRQPQGRKGAKLKLRPSAPFPPPISILKRGRKRRHRSASIDLVIRERALQARSPPVVNFKTPLPLTPPVAVHERAAEHSRARRQSLTRSPSKTWSQPAGGTVREAEDNECCQAADQRKQARRLHRPVIHTIRIKRTGQPILTPIPSLSTKRIARQRYSRRH
jgi:hypothetical protein